MLATMIDDSNIHNRLILAVVNKLLVDGYKVSANHIGYPNGKPPEYKGYTPDIIGNKGEKKIIFEAETCNSIDCEARSRWTLLLELSKKENYKLAIIVPMDCYEKAKKLAENWQIKFDEFWAMDL